MSQPQNIIEILDPGYSATLQDLGRTGWRTFGVPPSGAMDPHAAQWANRLLGNPPHAPLIEFLLQGAKTRILKETWIAVTGADASSNVPPWHAVKMRPGDLIEFPRNRSGLWIYLAVAGGFHGPVFLGSASCYSRGHFGTPLQAGNTLRQFHPPVTAFPRAIAGRSVSPDERRDYQSPPRLRVWPGPQWSRFSPADQTRFFQQEWTLTSQCDRTGYRLSGEPLTSFISQIISEPVLPGAIQIPENGSPIVTMPDGPTVGGYPKLGLIDPDDLPWLAQCRPGQTIRFQSVTGPSFAS
jgi:biotin-dependent carboxylase-like uncharacterized protein